MTQTLMMIKQQSETQGSLFQKQLQILEERGAESHAFAAATRDQLYEVQRKNTELEKKVDNLSRQAWR